MATKIRLTRLGKKGEPTYRIAVFEEGQKRDGKYLENLGTYNPLIQPHKVQIDTKKLQYWLARGAQPTDTVAKLIKSYE